MELLLEEGASKNSKNRWGQTPLSEALENRYKYFFCRLRCDLEK